jgi:hypothetical protein
MMSAMTAPTQIRAEEQPNVQVHRQNTRMSLKDKIRIQQIKHRTRPVDALPLFQKVFSKMSHNEREEFNEDIKQSFDNSGQLMLERAYLEKLLTPLEVATLFHEQHLDVGELGVILQAYFAEKDNAKFAKEGVLVLTMPFSNIYKAKDFLWKRFHVRPILMSELLTRTKNKNPEDYAKLVEALSGKDPITVMQEMEKQQLAEYRP